MLLNKLLTCANDKLSRLNELLSCLKLASTGTMAKTVVESD